MVFLDKKGRFLSQIQLAAIFAQSKNRGVSERQLNKTNITSLNDEIREEQKKGEKDYKVALNKAITKVFKVPSKSKPLPALKVNPVVLNKEERKVVKSGEPLRVIDLIRNTSAVNGIDHVEAKRLLIQGKVIPPGISDDAVIKPNKPISKNLLKQDKETPQTKVKEILQLLGEGEREKIARRNALISGRFQAGKKPIPEPKSEIKRKISDAAIRKLIDEQKETQRKQKVLIEMGNLRDERAVILQKGLEQPTTTVTISEPAGPPLTTPGLVTGLDPLKLKSQETIKDKIRRRALDLEVINGLSPQLAMDQAKKEIVRQQLG